MLIHRQANLLQDESATVAKPAWASNFQVIACPVGGMARTASNGTTTGFADVGHGFAVGDKVLIYDNGSATFINDPIASTTRNTFVWTSATPTYSKSALFVNLGPDPGTGGTPDYDSSPLRIWEDSDGADTPITDSKVTCDSQGNYSYWHAGDGRNWELVLDASDEVQGVIPGYGGWPGRYNVCDYGAVGDDSTDNALRINAALLAADGAAAWLVGGPLNDYRAASAINIPAGGKLKGDCDAVLYRDYSSGSLGVGEAFIMNENVATVSDDGIQISGFQIDLGDTTYTGDIIQLWSDGGHIYDLNILDFGAAGIGGRAILARGDDFRISRVKAYSDLDQAGNGGIIWTGGTGCVVSDCSVRSGDDCFGCNIWTSGLWANASASQYTLSNCHAISNAARMFFTGGTGIMTADITDVVVNNLTGYADNGVVHVNMNHASSTGSIKRVYISNVVGDGVLNDEANRTIYVNDESANQNVQDVHFSNIITRVTGNASDVSGPILFKNVARCSIRNSTIDATSQAAAALNVIATSGVCTDMDVCQNTIRCSTTPNSAWSAVQYGSGTTNTVTGGHIDGNTILDIPGGLIAQSRGAIFLAEASGVTVRGNRVTPGASGSYAIYDGGGTVEGDNVIEGNNLIEFWDEPAIFQNNEGDCVYENNLGHNPVGFENYTADTTPAQGDVPLRAKTCYVTVGTEDDSVTLPAAIHNREITIINSSGSNDLQIFPASGDSIAGASVDTSMYLLNTAVGGNGSVTLRAANATQWVVIAGSLSATS